jgi:hypothetical protein
MIFPKRKRDDDDANLVMCYRITEMVRVYLEGGRKDDAQHIREMCLDAMFRIMEDYRYDAFGRSSSSGVPGSPGSRLLRRFLMLAQRCVYPEYARKQEPVALHIQSILRKLHENEKEWDIRMLDADGPRVVRFFEILSNRLEKAKKKQHYL